MMDQDPLDRLLRSYAGKPLPAESTLWDADVWREIERLKQRRTWHSSLMEGWRGVLLERRLSLAAIALAVVVGAAPSVLHDDPGAENILAQQSLHLEVFSANSTAFRASLLRAPVRGSFSR